MQYALIENERRSAAPGLSGTCPVCSAATVARCGKQRVWHWAHKGARTCDDWWEPETVWHRNWKNRFPIEWQECIAYEVGTGEKHIADVRTIHGLTLEFQHSHLDPVERAARERFHGNMVWIVDGTRLKRDEPRFRRGMDYTQKTLHPAITATHFPDESFPKDWIDSSVPVLFDFGDPIDEEGNVAGEATLWCLLPGRAEGRALFGPLPKSKFVELALAKPEILDAKGLVESMAGYYRDQRRQSEIHTTRMVSIPRFRARNPYRRRRF